MNLIRPFFFDTLSHPWVLLLLLAVVALFIAELFSRASGSVVVSTGETLAGIMKKRPVRLSRLPILLRALGLALLVVALAGPLNGFQVRKDRAKVIDIMLCVDVSGSMSQQDFVSKGKPRDRLYVTKEAVRDFINSRRERVEDRYGLDRVGLVLYSGFAWTQCPLTLDYDVLEHELDKAEINEYRQRGTAIGSAIGLGVRRLSQSDAKSKVLILLTDGQNNAGELDPLTAAGVAKDYGMRVYTIGAGTTEGGWTGGIFGQPKAPIDEEMLKKIAEITGARYYRATDTQSLEEAYAEINQLETTEVDIGDYYEYKEAFMPYVLLGAILILGSIVMRRQWFEPVP